MLIWIFSQRFLTLTLVACATFGASVADVSHLAKHYIPPRTMMMSPDGANNHKAEMVTHSDLPITHVGEHTVTTIEQQELRELPTQTEYLQPGQTPYGVGMSNGHGNNGHSSMPSGAHDAEKPLAMMMPRELLPHSEEKLHEQKAPAVAPNKRYLAPEMNGAPGSRTSQSGMPSRQYLTPPMMAAEQRQQEIPVPSTIKLYSAPMMNTNEPQEPQEQHHAESQAPAPSKQYLTPMAIQMQTEMNEGHQMTVPSKQYLAPLPTISGADNEQQIPQQSAPAPRYLPPQQQQQMMHQMHEMPANQYVAPHMATQEMQMQRSTELAQRPAPATHYLAPSSMQMSREQPVREQAMPVALQMQPSREYLSSFGEAENVAEAAQVAAEMLNEQSVRQPMPPAAEGEPANYYLPPQSAAQPLNYQQHQFNVPQSSKPLPPVDFVRQHHQLMKQHEGAPKAPVSFAQFQSINSIESNSESMPAHFLADDGYHYRYSNSAAGRFRVRH